MCFGPYSILCDFGAFTSFSAYTQIQSEKVEISVIIVHLTWYFANTSGHFDFDFDRRMRSSNVQGFVCTVLPRYEEEE